MRFILMILSVSVASAVFAADQLLTVTTTATNAATAVSATAQGFTGEIDEIAVITAAGVTGNVSIVAAYPYGGASVVLATNTVASTPFWVFRPRLMNIGVAGAAALVVTNEVGGDKFMVAGETITATVSGASATSSAFKVRIKYEK